MRYPKCRQADSPKGPGQKQNSLWAVIFPSGVLRPGPDTGQVKWAAGYYLSSPNILLLCNNKFPNQKACLLRMVELLVQRKFVKINAIRVLNRSGNSQSLVISSCIKVSLQTWPATSEIKHPEIEAHLNQKPLPVSVSLAVSLASQFSRCKMLESFFSFSVTILSWHLTWNPLGSRIQVWLIFTNFLGSHRMPDACHVSGVQDSCMNVSVWKLFCEILQKLMSGFLKVPRKEDFSLIPFTPEIMQYYKMNQSISLHMGLMDWLSCVGQILKEYSGKNLPSCQVKVNCTLNIKYFPCRLL